MDIPNVRFLDESSGNYQAASAANKVMDKDDFLRLLVAKLTTQDPLSPMKDEDFVAQLAQFSSLEQLTNMNDNLKQDIQWNYLLSQTISNTMATSLIGRTVKAESSILYVEQGGTADVAFNLDRTAAEVTITIRDQNGRAVRTITEKNLETGDHGVKWDGIDDSGAQAAAGAYTIEITATDEDGKSFTPLQRLEGKVMGVTYRDGIALLNVNGQLLPLASVLEVKEG